MPSHNYIIQVPSDNLLGSVYIYVYYISRSFASDNPDQYLVSTSFRQSKCLTTSPLDFGLSRQTFPDLPRSQIFQATEQIGVIAALRRHSAWCAAWSTVCGWTALAWTDPWNTHKKIILKEHVQIETLQKNDVLWENVVWYTSNCKSNNTW